MSKSPAQSGLSSQYLLFIKGFILFVLYFLLAQPAFAFENPHLYYDWNTYYDPSQVLGTQVLQGATESAQPPPPTPPHLDFHDYKQFDGYLLGDNLDPDNRLYFLKRLQENVALTFTFDAQKREETRLTIAGERLSEMERMAAEGKANLVTSLAQTYDDMVSKVTENLERLKGEKQDVSGLLAGTDIEMAKHVLVLEGVVISAPQQAIGGLQTALIAGERTVDTVADLAGRPAIPKDLIDRLQSLKAQGLLTGEEVTKIVGLDSRVAAREELRKLAEARVLPEADFKKLDEAARAYFPQGYAIMIELKKFEELRNLETQRPDDATLTRIQGFADKYKPGDIIPSELRRWWIPMVRLEELQNTIRPDLISEDLFRYRPDYQQKYTELVERIKPLKQDVEYVNSLIRENPSLLNDPAYARIKAIADKFGAIEESNIPPPDKTRTCTRDSHWVSIPFMPNGGYCVPNIVYVAADLATVGSLCPPGYHRNDPQGACYPDNPYGPGGGPGRGSGLPAPGTCFSGYHWVAEPTIQSGGYCSPDYPTIGGGPYPGPITPPSYCPEGHMFRDGKCEKYNPPPANGCPAKSWWNGQKCVEHKDCGQGRYQDSNGECKSTSDQYRLYESQCAGRPIPPNGCGAGYWDMATCSCRYSYATPVGGDGTVPKSPGSCPSGYNWVPEPINPNGGYCTSSSGGGGGTGDSPSRESQEAACRAGGGTCTRWYNEACSCEYPNNPNRYGGEGSTCQPPASGCSAGWFDYTSCSCNTTTPGGQYLTPPYGTPSGGGSCGPGYFWNGSYCSISGTPPSYGTPSGSYQTPYYGTPSGGYPTPSYGTPSGSYGSPTYGSPPPYGSPSYGTPEYSSPPPYGTPEYSSPPPYETPPYGTPP